MALFSEQRCLNCFGAVMPPFGWQDIFFQRKKSYLCVQCEANLERISGPVCSFCFRELNRLAPEYVVDGVCLDCVRWKMSTKCFLDGNTSLFHYNEFLKDIIARIKYRGDYELFKIFSGLIQLRKVDVVVPIPLSRERHLERGFNQAEAIGVLGGTEMVVALNRIHSEKQAKKDREARLAGVQVFSANAIDVSGKSVLLLDDIYTTGRTLQYAAEVLKEDCGACTVHSFTLIRG